MKRCSVGGCREKAWAAGECLDHYVAHRHDIDRGTALAIRNAEGTVGRIAADYGVSRRRVWEIRQGRWWGHIQ